MKNNSHVGIRGAVFGGAVLAMLAIQPASATTTFATGNLGGLDQVNVAADTNAISIIGNVQSTSYQMTFENMVGPTGDPGVEMHGQNGVAFIESYLDFVGPTHTGFQSLTLVAMPGTGWSSGDFALDQLNNSTAGNVTFTPYDQYGVLANWVLALDTNGQSQYHWTTAGGELLTKIVITVPTANMLQDFKQLGLQVSPVPLPAALPLFASGAGVMGLLGWWRKKRKAAAEIVV